MWCDEIVILVHSSMDGTYNIACSIGFERVSVLYGSSPVFEEMRLRQWMLECARDRGATHMALIDDDELLTGNMLRDVGMAVKYAGPGSVLQLPWLQLSRDRGDFTNDEDFFVMTSGMWGTQNVSVAFGDHPALHWAPRDGYDFHHRNPMGMEFNPFHCLSDRTGGLMHLQFLSRRRLLVKQFLYQLTERLRWPGRDPIKTVVARYAPTVYEADAATLQPCPDSWWAPYSHLMEYLHIDAEPWQENECKRLLMENPGIEGGLDDFGLMKEWGLGGVR